MIYVVAAVIHNDGKYLIARRPFEKHHGGLWEFPGGKILPGETPEEAIDRELREELSLRIEAVNGESGLITEDQIAIRFLDVLVVGEMELSEHQAAKWCTPDELLELPLCPIDERFVRKVLNA